MKHWTFDKLSKTILITLFYIFSALTTTVSICGTLERPSLSNQELIAKILTAKDENELIYSMRGYINNH